MARSNISTDEVREIVARQKAARNARPAAAMHNAKRVWRPTRDPFLCDCGMPAGYHTRDCVILSPESIAQYN